ncbi:MAG: hypothetical protein OEY38_12055, partial [Gammaproteobacteria bacterium]|nr:hypothetical protein [Gammaproteobacteria bacterium]
KQYDEPGDGYRTSRGGRGGTGGDGGTGGGGAGGGGGPSAGVVLHRIGNQNTFSFIIRNNSIHAGRGGDAGQGFASAPRGEGGASLGIALTNGNVGALELSGNNISVAGAGNGVGTSPEGEINNEALGAN